jgi:hypothetical protein
MSIGRRANNEESYLINQEQVSVGVPSGAAEPEI